MINFLKGGNRGNKNIVEVTVKSISITILLPLLPLLPPCISSRVRGRNFWAYTYNKFLNLHPMCILEVTEVTAKKLDLLISIFLLPLIKIRGNRKVTKEVTR